MRMTGNVEYKCKKCGWRYNGDMSHMYVILKHKKKHGEDNG